MKENIAVAEEQKMSVHVDSISRCNTMVQKYQLPSFKPSRNRRSSKILLFTPCSCVENEKMIEMILNTYMDYCSPSYIPLKRAHLRVPVNILEST